jgi:hypothetical protein
MRIFHIGLFLCVQAFCVHGQGPALTVPFECNSEGCMLIKLNINDSINGVFYFDTGSSTPIFDWNFVRKSHLQTCGTGLTVHLDGIGEGGGEDVEIIKNVQFRIGEDYLFHTLALVSNIPKAADAKDIDGIIGLSFFADKIIEFDFDKNEFYIYDDAIHPIQKEYKLVKTVTRNTFPKSANKILDKEVEKKIYVNMIVQINDMLKINGYFMFDTGWNSFPSVFTKTAMDVGLIHQPTLAEIELSGAGFGGGTRIDCFLPVPFVQIADMRIENTVLAYSKDKKGSRSQANSTSRQMSMIGLLGIKAIKKFNWILDLKNNKVYVKSNQNFKKQLPSDTLKLYNISVKSGADHMFYIGQVLKNQPKLTGISANDTIYGVTTSLGQLIPLVQLKDSLSNYTDIPLKFIFNKNNSLLYKIIQIQKTVISSPISLISPLK